MGMAEPEMIWETMAKASWCHVSGAQSRPEHAIAEGKYNHLPRHYCPRCGMWLESARNPGRHYDWFVIDDLVGEQAQRSAIDQAVIDMVTFKFIYQLGLTR
jgi:hypothetical protein